VPEAAADIPLTSVKGVGPARARLLQAAGILTADHLARATSAQVLTALAGAPAATPELAMSLIANATATLTGKTLVKPT
jgi:predicted RecB family nuclease